MTITANTGRQSLQTAYVDFTLADLTSGTDTNAIELPYGAVIVSGAVYTSVAFNSGSGDVIDVGDSASQNRYLNDASIAAVGADALVPTGYVHQGGWVTLRWTGTGTAATTGTARLVLNYFVEDRAETTFG